MRNISKIGYALIALLFLGYLILPGQIAKQGDKKPNQQTAETTEVKQTVGILQLMSHPALDQITQGVIDELANRGYVDGENIVIDLQNGQGEQDKLKAMAERFMQEDAAIMIGIATPAAQSLANVSDEVPIIMGAISDPVAANLVASIEKPGKNITGVSDTTPIKKQLELMQQLLPDVKTVGILYSSNEDNSISMADEAETIATEMGLKVEKATISSTNDLNQIAGNLARNVDAIWVPTDNQVASAMNTLVAIANEATIPVFPAVDTMVEEGGTASYSFNQYEVGIATGRVAADILDGAKPADYPIVFATEGDLIINKKQIDLLNLTVPEDLLAEAKIIE